MRTATRTLTPAQALARRTPIVTRAQRHEARQIGLVLPYPCSRRQASDLIGAAHAALRAADRG